MATIRKKRTYKDGTKKKTVTSKRKTKVVLKGKSKVKQKVKYNKDGSVKKVVNVQGGKRFVQKYNKDGTLKKTKMNARKMKAPKRKARARLDESLKKKDEARSRRVNY